MKVLRFVHTEHRLEIWAEKSQIAHAVMLLFPAHGQDFQDSWKLRLLIKSKDKVLDRSPLRQNNFLAFWRNQLSSGCHVLIVLILFSQSENVKGPWFLKLRRRPRGLQRVLYLARVSWDFLTTYCILFLLAHLLRKASLVQVWCF